MAAATLARDPAARNDAAAGLSAGDDFLVYLDILRSLGEQGAAVNCALLEAHTAATAGQRRIALTRLHNRLRDMAATANDALGSWPEPGDAPA